MHPLYDCIVVGSGPSGVQAAQTLLEGKMKVLMLDVGIKQGRFYQDNLPTNSFTQMRESDPNQHHYFLGKDLDSVAKDWQNKQDRLTPPLAFTKELVGLWQSKIDKNKNSFLWKAWPKGAWAMLGAEAHLPSMKRNWIRWVWLKRRRIGVIKK